MKRNTNYIDRLDIAKSCSTNWDSMIGNEQIRFCSECSKNVHNISRLTRKEAEALLANTQGRLCARFERRLDGTIITREPDDILFPSRLRAPRLAAATISTLMSFCMSATANPFTNAGQTTREIVQTDSNRTTLRKPGDGKATLQGTVFDANRAVITDATLTVTNASTNEARTAITDGEGKYIFSSLESGVYTLKAESPGFHLFREEHLNVQTDQVIRLDVMLEVGATMGDVVLIPKKTAIKRLLEILKYPFSALKKTI